MTGRRRPKSVRKARANAITRQERTYSKDPHSFIFTRPGVGSLVKQLSLDLREIFEPYTATRLKTHKRNVLKDFITIAGPLHVTHLLYLTHPHADKREEKRRRQLLKKSKRGQIKADLESCPGSDTESQPGESFDKSSSKGGVFLHLVRVPHGPSLTFSVCEYSLKRDVTTLVRRVFDSNQFRTPPLLAMTGFGSLCPDAPGPKQPQPPPPHLRLLVDMFQNMLPPLNVQKLKLSTVRRILLISREVDLSTTSGENNQNPDDVIYIRHYHIHTENRSISRALRRLSMGGARTKKRRVTTGLDSLSADCVKGPDVPNALLAPGLGPGGLGKSSGVPNLAKYTCMEDFLTKAGMLSDSGLSDALSDMEEVDLPQTQVAVSDAGTPVTLTTAKKRKFVPAHGLRHLGTAKRATVRLTEIGPRLTLKLIKIEEGLNTGIVLYHRWHSRSLTEVADQAERLRQREALRASRRAEHEARRAANEAAREAHRQACLEGMRRAGQLPSKPLSDASETKASDGEDRDSDENANDEDHSQAEVHLGKLKVKHDKHSIPAVVGSKARKRKHKVILPVRGSLVTPKKTKVRLAGVNKDGKTKKIGNQKRNFSSAQ